MKLNDLKLNEDGIISEINNSDIKIRLMDVGFNRGVTVRPLFENYSMRAYLIKGTIICIRLHDSKEIEVIV